MKNKIMINYIVVLFILFSLFTPNVSKAAGDSTPPVLESINISPQVAKVGEKITVSAKITDDISGVKNAQLAFYYDLGNVSKIRTIFLKYDEAKQLWIGDYLVTDNDINGTWKIDSYQSEDKAGNRDYKYRDLISNYNHYFFVVNNPKEVDTTPPVVEDIQISPKKVDVGQEVTISIKASDKSGIDLFQTDFDIYEPIKKHFSKEIHYIYDEKTGYWNGKYKILSNDIKGLWYLKIWLSDKAGNSTYVDSNNYIIEVNNQLGGDFSPPSIEWLTISPRVVTINDTVFIKAKVNDNMAGVDGVDLYLLSPSRNSKRLIYLYDKDKDGIWEGAYQVTNLDEVGKWDLEIGVYDKANNAKVFSSKDFINVEELSMIIDDLKPPASPKVNSVSDISKFVTGTSESQATITVTIDDNKYKTVVDKDGIFSVPIPKQRENTKIIVTATDPAGNQSEATILTVLDRTPPSSLKVNFVTDNSKEIKGSSDPSSKITIKIGNKKYTVETSVNGSFKVAIPQQKAETRIEIYATDNSDNISDSVIIYVLDKTPPNLAMVNKINSNSTVITGKTEAFATVTIKSGNKVIGTTIAKKDGSFSVKIKKQRKNTVINITVKDKSNNVSKSKNVKVL